MTHTFECCVVGHHDSGVQGENQDEPVPDAFERGVVDEDVGRGSGNFLAVSWHFVFVGEKGVLRALVGLLR